jgi:2,4-dienoyl-CoA reductase-like NADH-dependent reductase (Old Yellow Enzyme family)
MLESLNTRFSFANGKQIKNRFMLAPLTNTQSHENGQLSDDEFNWLTMRAKGRVWDCYDVRVTCTGER